MQSLSFNTSPKKPSPLSHASGSPRTSPFKRAASPAQGSPASSLDTSRSRAATPSTVNNNHSHSEHHSTPERPQSASRNSPGPWSPARDIPEQRRESPGNGSPVRLGGRDMHGRNGTGADPLSKLHPAQLREMRECFQTLDRDSDGLVGGADVADMLGQLGQDSSLAALSRFFPPQSSGSTINLSAYLTSMASLIAPLSASHELNAAFSAFDRDDSGQIDIVELREALLHVAVDDGEIKMSARDVDTVLGEFRSKRAFGKGMTSMDAGRRGDVFRYRDFVGAVSGAGSARADSNEGPPVEEVGA